MSNIEIQKAVLLSKIEIILDILDDMCSSSLIENLNLIDNIEIVQGKICDIQDKINGKPSFEKIYRTNLEAWKNRLLWNFCGLQSCEVVIQSFQDEKVEIKKFNGQPHETHFIDIEEFSKYFYEVNCEKFND